MFETTFQHASFQALPSAFDVRTGLAILHDFNTVVRLSPDCRGCKSIPPPKDAPKSNGTANDVQYYEVEDDLPFIPKRLWTGGVRYRVDFVPMPEGCDITVYAPGGFTSVNHWRLLREQPPEGEKDQAAPLERTMSKDMLHAATAGGGWYVQIASDARCSRTFAGFVKGFLKNNHEQLEIAFIERVKAANEAANEAQDKAQETPQRPPPGSRRPTLGRRRSSRF